MQLQRDYVSIEAELNRGSVYLAGETVECTVKFKCQAPSTSRQVQSLAWVSAQIHCQCHISESKVQLPVSGHRLSTEYENIRDLNNTDFIPSRGEKGECVFSTQPKILCCDLRLLPGQCKTFMYKETIPKEAPPSYRGQAVKYSYKITIGAQRIGCPIKLLRVPLRVLVLYGLGDVSMSHEDDELESSNPFLAQSKPQNSLLDLAMQVLMTVTSKKSPNTYNITNTEGVVARFCLFKPAFKLGEDIIGTIDFSQSTVPCLQYSVVLQSEEQVSEECRRRPDQTPAFSSHGKHQEFCLHMKKSHMILPIPLHVTPSFITDIVCLKWRLHFQFMTSKEPIHDHVIPADQSESAVWQGPESLPVDTLVWNLPIKILPTNPLQAACASIMRTNSAMKC
ncbi:RAB6A-GEF complex partner protein 2 [Holothuria leucospilota]|uniref:RAB6A-GEF complex partner protein 2 n=1 Tax=Holothuria leucospilota TaxID=206669 RepID=A0A9Q1BMK4_HOLLE|nr:RAB6A-GEF complex partner protein 2 [Holothuria leucospilota]